MLQKIIYVCLVVVLVVAVHALERSLSKPKGFSDLTEYGLSQDEERALVVSMFSKADSQSASRLARYYALDLSNGVSKAAVCMLISAVTDDSIGRRNWEILKKRNLNAIRNAELKERPTDDGYKLLSFYLEMLQARLRGDDAIAGRCIAVLLELGVNQTLLDSGRIDECLCR